MLAMVLAIVHRPSSSDAMFGDTPIQIHRTRHLPLCFGVPFSTRLLWMIQYGGGDLEFNLHR